MRFLKKALSLFLITVIVTATAFCNFTFNASAAVVTTAYIDGENVNVRKEPSTKATIIEQVSNRSATVLEETVSEERVWYKITYHNGKEQIIGYIAYDKDYIRIVTYNPDADFEEKLSAFPESYHDSLRALHSVYPNWEFTPDPVTVSFNEAVASQMVNLRKMVHISSQPVSWRSLDNGAYIWDTGKWVYTDGTSWVAASREIIAYYMDPRNFLNSDAIYMFLQQGYDRAVQTEAGVAKIIKGTFMETNYEDPDDTLYGGSYVKVIMAAAEQSGVSPYVLAAKIRQEIGVKAGDMVSGTTSYGKYFNFFNIGAYGENVLAAGLQKAKEEGWTTRSASIIGGAKFLSNSYISVGQDTYYYQDFNVHNPDRLWHQYAGAVHDAYNKGVGVAASYKSENELVLNFRIPIYSSMPAKACEMPARSDKLNNYYFKNIEVSGLTPSFSMYNYSYALQISADTAVKIELPKGATFAGETEFALKKGKIDITLPVKSETGYLNNYKISVNATNDCKLYITTDGKIPGSGEQNPDDGNGGTTPEPEKPTVMLGDPNGDGTIDIIDLAIVQMHILKTRTLTGDSFKAGDPNKDGVVDIIDLAMVQMHILKTRPIVQ